MYKYIDSVLPKSAGFSMPPEWAEHECCWMGWLEDPLAWRGRHDAAKAALARLANTIADFEPVRMLVSEQSRPEASRLCGSNVELVCMEIDDGWLRDSGPTFIVGVDGDLAATDWKFNGWGDMEFANWGKDRLVADNICRLLDIPCFKPDLTTEGGAFHVDGDGTVLCTEPTLVDQNRNPGKEKEEIDQILCEYLGAEKVLWLSEGYFEDETGGHIDIFASFTKPGRLLHLDTDDQSDPNYKIFKKNIADLKTKTDAKGRSVEVVTMCQPPAYFAGERRLDLSYLNYYPANGAVIMPTFNIDEDLEAKKILKQEFPNREIVDFKDAHIFFHGGGGIHCLTQQQPYRSK